MPEIYGILLCRSFKFSKLNHNRISFYLPYAFHLFWSQLLHSYVCLVKMLVLKISVKKNLLECGDLNARMGAKILLSYKYVKWLWNNRIWCTLRNLAIGGSSWVVLPPRFTFRSAISKIITHFNLFGYM